MVIQLFLHCSCLWSFCGSHCSILVEPELNTEPASRGGRQRKKARFNPAVPRAAAVKTGRKKASLLRGVWQTLLFTLCEKKKSEFSRRRGDSWQTEHHFIPWYFIRNAARFLRQKQVSISCRAAFPSWPGLPSPCGACAVRCWTSVVFSLDLNTPRCGPWPSRPELLMSLKNSRLLLS